MVSSIDFQNKTEMSFDSLEVKLMDNDKLKQGLIQKVKANKTF